MKKILTEIANGLGFIGAMFFAAGFLHVDQIPVPAFITELDQQREHREEFSPKWTFNGFSVVKTNDLPNRQTIEGETYAYQESY